MPSIPLEGEVMKKELLTPRTVQMKFIQSKLFLFTPQKEDACLVTNEYADTIGHFAYMESYDIGNDGTITKVWDNFYAKVHSLAKDNEIHFHADNIEGFSDMTIGKKYIYAAYSGVESGEAKKQRSAMALYPKHLLVLDLNGKPLAKFDLGKRYIPLCLDEKEEYIYIKHYDPDVSLWRYKVSDILKHLDTDSALQASDNQAE